MIDDAIPFDSSDEPPATPAVDRPCVILLGQNGQHEAIVDQEDFSFLSQWRWNFLRSKRSTKIYARRGGGTRPGRSNRPTITMHKVIMERMGLKCIHGEQSDCPHKCTIDHENRKTLDNRRQNLRWATHAEQTANKAKPKKRSAAGSPLGKNAEGQVNEGHEA